MNGAVELQKIMSALISDCKDMFGEKLSEVRLYGSYARGEQTEYSDIDVMILLDMNDIEARKHLISVCDMASEISLAYDCVNVAPHICSRGRYDKMKALPGFYFNVMSEGVSMYAG